ncbi:MAG: hypothetical protein MHPSP_004448, partial [Paramarteilia canceri]
MKLYLLVFLTLLFPFTQTEESLKVVLTNCLYFGVLADVSHVQKLIKKGDVKVTKAILKDYFGDNLLTDTFARFTSSTKLFSGLDGLTQKIIDKLVEDPQSAIDKLREMNLPSCNFSLL